jgi:TetR/AcrR family transcriptional repressor of nem operon
MPQRNLREQLVEGGSRALYENGFHATSVSDIAAAAGVPKGSVYNHFESKEALALEALRRYAASFDLEPLRSGSAGPLQRLRTFLSGVIDTTVARGVELGCLLGNFSVEMSAHGGPIASLAGEMLDAWSTVFAGVLLEAQAAGDLDPRLDAASLGSFLVDAYEGAVARAKLRRDPGPLDAFMRVTFDVLLVPGHGKLP